MTEPEVSTDVESVDGELIDELSLWDEALDIGVRYVVAQRTANEQYEKWQAAAELLPESDVAIEAGQAYHELDTEFRQIAERVEAEFEPEVRIDLLRAISEQAGIPQEVIDQAVERVGAIDDALQEAHFDLGEDDVAEGVILP